MPQPPAPRTRRATLTIVGPALILGLSLGLLAWVGYEEARRSYPEIELEKIASEARVLAGPIETFLLAGQPLEHFPGFIPRAEPVVRSDAVLAGLTLTDEEGTVVAATTRGHLDEATASLPSAGRERILREDLTHYHLGLPLRSRYETAGVLWAHAQKRRIAERIDTRYGLVLLACGGVWLLFTAGLLLARGGWSRRTLAGAYTVAFAAAAVVLLVWLTALYGGGIEERTRAVARTLASRLETAAAIGLSLEDFTGFEELLQEYRGANLSGGYVAITQAGRTRLHTDPARAGRPWQPPSGMFRLAEPVPSLEAVTVRVGVPWSVLTARIGDALRSFAALFLASGFLAALLFNLLSVLESHGRESTDAPLDEAARLEMIAPYFFLGIFLEGLSVSFLAPVLRELAVAGGYPPSAASWPFTAFFAAFVIVLLPAGRWSERRGIRPLLMGGALLSAASWILFAHLPAFAPLLDDAFVPALVLRALGGAGQGILFIGVQSYILRIASRGRLTRGAAIIVTGYNGGMLSGMALGGLLAEPLGTEGVFLLAGGIGIAAFLYAARYLTGAGTAPSEAEIARRPKSAGAFLRQLGRGLRDRSFLSAVCCVGIPTKATLTGVTMFALPLLLAQAGYDRDDVGQILIFYAGAVLLVSRLAAPRVDRSFAPRAALLVGMLGSAVGLGSLGLLAWASAIRTIIPGGPTLLLLAGMTILGAAHGLIHAPIVTAVARTPAARAMGPGTAASLYRLLERTGHVLGPVLLGALLAASGEQPVALLYTAGGLLLLGVLYSILSRGRAA